MKRCNSPLLFIWVDQLIADFVSSCYWSHSFTTQMPPPTSRELKVFQYTVFLTLQTETCYGFMTKISGVVVPDHAGRQDALPPAILPAFNSQICYLKDSLQKNIIFSSQVLYKCYIRSYCLTLIIFLNVFFICTCVGGILKIYNIIFRLCRSFPSHRTVISFINSFFVSGLQNISTARLLYFIDTLLFYELVGTKNWFG